MVITNLDLLTFSIKVSISSQKLKPKILMQRMSLPRSVNITYSKSKLDKNTSGVLKGHLHYTVETNCKGALSCFKNHFLMCIVAKNMIFYALSYRYLCWYLCNVFTAEHLASIKITSLS